MKSISEYCETQYELVKGSRIVLLEYCRTISADNFIKENTSFGRGGSIRNLLVHNVNTYQFWIGNVALKKSIVYTPYESCNNIEQVTEIYNSVDIFFREFISETDFDSEIEFTINGSKGYATPFKLFSHVITHEFHHKGQILSLSRHLGYKPIDTDIMR